jgi:hypothetical protein
MVLRMYDISKQLWDFPFVSWAYFLLLLLLLTLKLSNIGCYLSAHFLSVILSLCFIKASYFEI